MTTNIEELILHNSPKELVSAKFMWKFNSDGFVIVMNEKNYSGNLHEGVVNFINTVKKTINNATNRKEMISKAITTLDNFMNKPKENEIINFSMKMDIVSCVGSIILLTELGKISKDGYNGCLYTYKTIFEDVPLVESSVLL